MAAPQTAPLRPLTAQEAATLQRLVKATSERHDRRQRARALLVVSTGASFCDAARQAGYQEPESVSKLVARFNQRGLAALDIARGRGRPATYGPTARARILGMLRRPPQRRADGTATWSLVLLERALRQEAGLEHLSATTIREVLHAAGYTFQRTRSWCPTGTARRVRRTGVVTVVDPQAEQKRG
jgi:transposase